ncbi:hypothetical protein SETIT_6G042100v2 [Setaria italica]|uniref:Major facilitator superfamily (MFS) profile domain-containing protein n=1 Tax=Setaria italica TaxID=4555 RepID=A0A368RHW8_SETIT|nr:uncharacterized protein LOC101761928 [Setaria italica]RCV29799.1 hypothetical protein SETIT_6G042100v2 [Setaria italica]
MTTPGTTAMFAGLAILLFSVSAGFNSGAGGFGLLLCFAGVLAGANIVAVGILAPVVPAVLAEARALAEFLGRNLAVVGLVMASCAVTAVSGEAGQVLCFGMFALLLLGLSLISVGILGLSQMH